ncbi:MAG: MFS transporter [Gemmatimonadota bacterium]|nr:MFS transporter [Gemmatimonadota bacterium]MDH5759234.1 MFS transporter [Gemmatimonadota bacterium]
MSNLPTEAFRAPVSDKDRTLILVGILLALFLAALDQTIVSTALPRIVEDLEGVSRYAWVATSYLLASTVLVPIYGKLADTYPRKFIELGAVTVFLTGSVLCGLAGEFGTLPVLGDGMMQLVVFRGIQGAGGAGLIAMTFIVIADLFTPAERGRYQGLVGAVWGIASVLGPVVGGLLTDHGGALVPGVEGWRWVFYVNVPVGALAVWFLVRRMPRLDPGGERVRPDVRSALYMVGGLTPLVLALQLDRRRFPWLPGMHPGSTSPPWASWVTMGSVLLGGTLLAAFVVRSRRVASPIVDLGLFRNRVFRRANASAFFFGAAFMSLVIFLPLFLVNVVDVSATRAGMALIPFSLGLVFGSTAAGHSVSRFGRLRDHILAGGVLLLGAMVFLARMDADVSYWTVTAYMLMAGLGMGPSLPLFTLAIQNSVDVRRIGQATSAAQFFRQIGGTVGTAFFGTVLATTLGTAFAALGLPPGMASTGDTGVERLVSTGGVELPARVRGLYADRAVELERTMRAGDDYRFDSLVITWHLPAEVVETLRGPAPGAGASLLGDEGRIRAGSAAVTRLGEEEASRIRGEVAGAFARATHRVYAVGIWVMVAALLLALRIPEVPLRRTHDHPAPGAPD